MKVTFAHYLSRSEGSSAATVTWDCLRLYRTSRGRQTKPVDARRRAFSFIRFRSILGNLPRLP